MRYLGIDYGAKRIGLAQGDEIGVATPLPAVIEPAGEARWTKLAEVIRVRRITEIVIGYPYNMDGSVGFKAKEVDAFVAELKTRFSLPVHLVDETLTSYAAESSIKKKNLRDVRDTGLIDSRAATIILQDFLDQRNPPLTPTE
jgi:putative Holliday junction resolvase